jgi:8-oxo-dGTP pyrophosphatase MutT (NUDIX family)
VKLTLDHVARRLSQHLGTAMPNDELTGAVLIPFVAEAEPTLLFTRRAAALANFPGEVSFPGGKREASDETLLATALRETHEEIRVPPGQVDVVGRIDDGWVYGRHRIRSYVGFLRPEARPEADPAEVERIFTVRLAALAVPQVYEGRRLPDAEPVEGPQRVVHYFRAEGEVIWGATGRIVADLLQIVLGWKPPQAARAVGSWDDFRKDL